ncbi:hypothetical protein ACFXNW_09975 [Nocardia sp. NPDC059180]|uniref:hypothetical protein n=1 Tax=Nocardia sp. NPDC059180 TaxID=3346761 RepID=UPI003697E799
MPAEDHARRHGRLNQLATQLAQFGTELEALDRVAAEPEPTPVAAGILDRVLAQLSEQRATLIRPVPTARVREWVSSDLAASTGSGAVQRTPLPELGVEIVRSCVDGATTFVIYADPAVRREGEVVLIDPGADATAVLVVLHTYAEALLGGVVVPDAVTASFDVAVFDADSDHLDRHAETVTESVRCATGAGKSVWKRIARARAATDPVRVAVLAGLKG